MKPGAALLVSRSSAVRTVLGAIGSSLGWDLRVVASFREVQEKLEEPSPDAGEFNLVLVDLAGIDFADAGEFHRLERGEVLPLIVIGLLHSSQRQSAEEAFPPGRGRFDQFLIKPFTTSMLLEAVKSGRAVRESRLPVKPDKTKESARLRDVHVLLVEDNPFNQQVAYELLKSEGAEVVIASDGSEALDKLRGAAPRVDAVLMDVQMPGMDGLEATRKIRTSLGLTSLPIIAMTANALPSDKAACFEAGMDSHLDKPIDSDRLVKTLLRFVGPAQPHQPKPVFDGQGAVERFGNDWGVYEKVLNYWLQNTPSLVESLRKAATGGNGDLARFFHSLKARRRRWARWNWPNSPAKWNATRPLSPLGSPGNPGRRTGREDRGFHPRPSNNTSSFPRGVLEIEKTHRAAGRDSGDSGLFARHHRGSRPQSETDTRDAYNLEILKLALESTRGAYGDYSLRLSENEIPTLRLSSPRPRRRPGESDVLSHDS